MDVQSQGKDEGKERTLSPQEFALSMQISLLTGARWGHCYENAYPMVFAFPHLFEPHGLFVEGWIVLEDEGKVIVMEHGWLITNDQHIVDPTIVLSVNPGQPVYYYPGVSRARSELEALENEFFPHVRFSVFGEDGMQHPEYCAAYEAAQQKATSLLTEEKTLLEVRARGLEEVATSESEAASDLIMFVILPDQHRQQE